ncbi:hypothetical protein ACFW2X_03495 [Streptomyces antibioticus]|uniref:hypothetical protein n=1 Tax=Streptomyces antibioticus TaxID=1890 RepID=UPI0036CCB18A
MAGVRAFCVRTPGRSSFAVVLAPVPAVPQERRGQGRLTDRAGRNRAHVAEAGAAYDERRETD